MRRKGKERGMEGKTKRGGGGGRNPKEKRRKGEKETGVETATE